ncbi:MAG: 50S ribosomal protein L6 [Thaumarchaeota archaeon]|nr:50S ribosomal protein L6 [Candidatus Calditenuaceae archaeon]MDW8042535.1 50S ribosomal protein L6 [Nitrososphaerota archaeon]
MAAAEGTEGQRVVKRYVEEVLRVEEGVKVTVEDGGVLRVKGPLGELTLDFRVAGVEFIGSDGGLVVRVHGKGKKAKALLGTVRAKVRNAALGVTKGFTYKLKIVKTHFPMSVKVQGDTLLIENFTGERVPRTIKLVPGVKVAVKGDDVIVSGIDKEKVGLTAGMIEQATKIREKDLRKFLDGIYVYEKSVGRE